MIIWIWYSTLKSDRISPFVREPNKNILIPFSAHNPLHKNWKALNLSRIFLEHVINTNTNARPLEILSLNCTSWASADCNSPYHVLGMFSFYYSLSLREARFWLFSFWQGKKGKKHDAGKFSTKRNSLLFPGNLPWSDFCYYSMPG